MPRFQATALALTASVILSGCAIEIDGGDRHAYWHSDHPAEMHVGDSRIIIEQRLQTPEDAVRQMDLKMSALRQKNCLIASANSWQEIQSDKGRQHQGYRIVANCPEGQSLF